MTGKQIVLRLSLALAVAVTALAACLGVWWKLFEDLPGDPRGPRYVFWRWGLREFEPSLLGPFMRDRAHEDMIRGRTRQELAKFFGGMRIGPGYTHHHSLYQRFLEGTDHAWIGDSWFVVRFENGRAVALHLMKG